MYRFLQILLFTPLIGFSQIAFEPGYFIDTSGTQIECLIKNLDWRYNPVEFKYKLSDVSAVQTKSVSEVSEFGLTNGVKYISRLIEIDRSSADLKDMSVIMTPEFVSERLFLKVLVKSQASLYSYEDGEIIRYFYQTDRTPLTQLVYKQYRKDGGVASNTYFRQQLFTTLECSDILLSDVEDLPYQRKPLMKLFLNYNNCEGEESWTFQSDNDSKLFRFSLRPGLTYSSMSLTLHRSGRPPETTDFGSQFGFRLGIELEATLPFYQRKIALALEPTYQSFIGTIVEDGPFTSSQDVIHEIYYQSIELPVLVRHYVYLSNQSRLFINGIVYADFNLNSTYKNSRADGSSTGISDIKLNSKISYGAGLGYDFGSKYFMECRYLFGRDLINKVPSRYTDYTVFSLVVGWTFLKL